MQIYGPSHIHGAQPINTPHATRGPQAPAASTAPAIGDQLDLSEAGKIAGRLADLPEIRGERVQQLRAAIADGTYETHDKLSTAVERLLDEIA